MAEVRQCDLCEKIVTVWSKVSLAHYGEYEVCWHCLKKFLDVLQQVNPGEESESGSAYPTVTTTGTATSGSTVWISNDSFGQPVDSEE